MLKYLFTFSLIPSPVLCYRDVYCVGSVEWIQEERQISSCMQMCLTTCANNLRVRAVASYKWTFVTRWLTNCHFWQPQQNWLPIHFERPCMQLCLTSTILESEPWQHLRKSWIGAGNFIQFCSYNWLSSKGLIEMQIIGFKLEAFSLGRWWEPNQMNGQIRETSQVKVNWSRSNCQ